MKIYRVKAGVIKGTDFSEVSKTAKTFYQKITKKSKRRPYVRSNYFDKDKVFLGLFWQHLFAKPNWRDRVRRLRYFPAAIEVIRYSKFDPKSEINRNKKGEMLYRFAGVTADAEYFFVQIKENKQSGQKFLMSVFPE